MDQQGRARAKKGRWHTIAGVIQMPPTLLAWEVDLLSESLLAAVRKKDRQSARDAKEADHA